MVKKIRTSKLLLWGASGHALVVADIIRLQGIYEIVGFIDNVNLQRHGETFCGLPILGGQEQLDICKQQGIEHIIFGFGDCQARLKLSELVEKKGFSLATAIHPNATIAADVSIGAGTVIAAGAVVNSGAKIGQNVIINTCASVDHECIIEDGTHICPGVHLAGRVTVGRATWVGIGATVIDSVRIGAGTVIGAGAVVVNDIPDRVLVYGVPAKVIRNID
ncbi:acetyltransferase [Nostoc sp. FACHB-152]|uniref:acetyltransferase n=1 Tax=unclassified Nostoc TaxID=2593658 RepID=UPI001684B0F8|nr:MULTISPECIES: acetyltransferase [unclassified Nostoc]MBD2451077.1 acetyltransferase [Nostoc sp. FACHB-152]MBD2472581.1 acetyltransferase [Nostoc sp. FACHB-145]